MTIYQWTWLAAVPLILASACSAPDDLTTPRPTVRPAPTPVPLDEPTPTPAPNAGAPAVPTLGQAGMRAPLPLSGEYAVTANRDDHTLSVVPIGLARAVATVSLDAPPRAVATAPDSDTAVTISETPSLSLASLNSSTVLGSVDAASNAVQVVSPPAEDSGVVLVLSEGDHVQVVDASSRTLGPPIQLDAGPHAVSFGRAGVPAVPRIFLSNADAGTVSVLDAQAARVDHVLHVGGRPVGVAQTIDSRLWVADAASGSIVQVDTDDGHRIEAIPLGAAGAGMTGLSATHDGHYLVLASSAADHALVSVDLLANALGQADSVVRSLAVDGGVLALATGAETTRAYATTAGGELLYWDLVSNSIAQTVTVGKTPVSLALGMVVPIGGASAPDTSASAASGGGGVAGGATSAPSGTSGTTSGGTGTTSGQTPGGSTSGASSTTGGTTPPNTTNGTGPTSVGTSPAPGSTTASDAATGAASGGSASGTTPSTAVGTTSVGGSASPASSTGAATATTSTSGTTPSGSVTAPGGTPNGTTLGGASTASSTSPTSSGGTAVGTTPSSGTGSTTTTPSSGTSPAPTSSSGTGGITTTTPSSGTTTAPTSSSATTPSGSGTSPTPGGGGQPGGSGAGLGGTSAGTSPTVGTAPSDTSPTLGGGTAPGQPSPGAPPGTGN